MRELSYVGGQTYRRQLHRTLKLALTLMNNSTEAFAAAAMTHVEHGLVLQELPLDEDEQAFCVTVLAECFIKVPDCQSVILGVAIGDHISSGSEVTVPAVLFGG